MKANELMIDDWVECVDSTHKKKVYSQIDAIEEGQTCILVRLDNSNWFLDISFIKPIPLTPEILEQNGFIYEPNSEEKDDGWWNWKAIGVSTGNEYVNIAFRGDNVAVYDLEIMKGFNSGTLHLDFIHQLQHSLRLFGIEKEIIL